MYKEVAMRFSDSSDHREFIEESKGHGREEKRVYQVLPLQSTVEENKGFIGMKSTIHVISYRQVKGQEMTVEDRYYISSLDSTQIELLSKSIRSHWSIENQLHYVLDVTLKEDDSRTKNLVGAENLLLFRRAIISLLNRVKGEHSVPRMLINAALSRDYRSKILDRLT